MAKKYVVNEDLENLCQNLQYYFQDLEGNKKKILGEISKIDKRFPENYELEMIEENINLSELKGKYIKLYNDSLTKQIDGLKIHAAIVKTVSQNSNDGGDKDNDEKDDNQSNVLTNQMISEIRNMMDKKE